MCQLSFLDLSHSNAAGALCSLAASRTTLAQAALHFQLTPPSTALLPLSRDSPWHARHVLLHPDVLASLETLRQPADQEVSAAGAHAEAVASASYSRPDGTRTPGERADEASSTSSSASAQHGAHSPSSVPMRLRRRLVRALLGITAPITRLHNQHARSSNGAEARQVARDAASSAPAPGARGTSTWQTESELAQQTTALDAPAGTAADNAGSGAAHMGAAVDGPSASIDRAKPTAPPAALSPAEQSPIQLWSWPAIFAFAMQHAAEAQTSPQLAATVWTTAQPQPRPMLPVDTVIMDEAACSTDYIMPCLLVMRPQHMVCGLISS